MMVIHRIKDMMELASSVKRYKEKMAAAVTERYTPRLRDGEAFPDYGLVLDLAVRDAQAALDELVELDDQVDDLAVDLDFLREDRDHVAKEVLHPRAVRVRGAIDLAFDRERGRSLHAMKGRTRRAVPHLEYQVRHALARLTDPDHELPPPRSRFSAVDREGWTRQLQGPYRRLLKLREEISRQEAELNLLGVLRKRAMDAFDAAYGEAVPLVKSVFAIAGFGTQMIKNLKPYYQRRRMSKEARKKREARAARAAEVTGAALAEATKSAEEKVPADIQPPDKEKRAVLSKTVAKWLAKRRVAEA